MPTARASMGILKLWTTDKSTFPIVLFVSCASAGAAYTSFRYLRGEPDVCVNKDKRENTLHHDENTGSSWRQHRFRMATLVRNPINQSRQFDDLYNKDENKGAKR